MANLKNRGSTPTTRWAAVLCLTALAACAAPPPTSHLAPEPTEAPPRQPPPLTAATAAVSAAPAVSEHAAVAPAASPPTTTALEPSSAEYRTPLRSESELARAARAACERAQRERRSLLIELSAPWCTDCVALERAKAAPPLRDELALWELLAINVGDGFEHPELMRAFRVTAIAKLVTTNPRNCAAELRHWPVRGTRTLEAARDDAELADKTAAWLERQRARLGPGSTGP